MASGVTGRMGQAMRFDEVLRRPSAESPTAEPDPSAADPSATDSPGQPTTDLTQQLSDAVRLELAKNSVSLNQRLELQVQADGSLRVEGDHPEAAKIEALLNSDPATVRLAGQLAKQTGVMEISIDLTSHGVLANMFGPGGYPNW